LPGNEACTADAIKQWFARQKYKHDAEPLTPSTSCTSYPTLTPDHIRTLSALFAAQKDAPDAVVRSWALVCAGAHLGDVQRWIRDQRHAEPRTPTQSPGAEGPPAPVQQQQRLSIRLPPLLSSAQQHKNVPPPLPNFRDVLAQSLSAPVDRSAEAPPRTTEAWEQQIAPYTNMLDKLEGRLRTTRFGDCPRGAP
ncbi:hypothetical protein HDZ31DRAFT_37784, partial [Schizophyllum fasciatum]